MKKEKIRISKPPEEQKQKIIDIVMVVFAEKGYEHTVMRDIAETVRIVPGSTGILNWSRCCLKLQSFGMSRTIVLL